MLLLALAAIALVGCDSTDDAASRAPRGPNVEAIYSAVPDWPKLPPGVHFGRVTSVAVNPAGDVYVAHTASAPEGVVEQPIAEATIFVFDGVTGELKRQLGKGLFRMPHGLAFDAKGQLWVTDSDANRVHQLNEEGQVVRTLGSD